MTLAKAHNIDLWHHDVRTFGRLLDLVEDYKLFPAAREVWNDPHELMAEAKQWNLELQRRRGPE